MKIDKTLLQIITALMVILVLFIPAITSGIIRDRTYNQIIAVQSDYVTGTGLNPVFSVNFTQVNNWFFPNVNRGADDYNDSFYVEHLGIDQIYYENAVTYLGNNTNQVNCDFNVMDNDTSHNAFYIPLNIIDRDLCAYDFIRLTTNGKHTQYSIESKYLYGNFQPLTNDTYILTFQYYMKETCLEFSPKENVSFMIGSPYQDKIDESDENFYFKLEAFELSPSDSFFWQDEHLYIGSIAISCIILGITFAFSTEVIDIKLDTKNGRKKKIGGIK